MLKFRGTYHPMLIAGTDFPEPLLTALRNGRLVIFAGAGVSMGAPAYLPSFRGLARQIAEGTRQTIADSDAEDLFLARLKADGVDVHQRAARLLQGDHVQPTELHRNLLLLFRKPEDIRIVTTNFDLLFEQRVSDVFDAPPKVFHAPALPVGRRFQGIAHVHGSVSVPKEMVLTSEDFGCAYLTEGWARRFLVDILTNHTVLFVGYSHSDTIMSYLTPAVPRHSDNPRYALTGTIDDTPERWGTLGISPIRFTQAENGDYSQLDNIVANLADRVTRGFLGWQKEIALVAGNLPPVEAELEDIIEYALGDPDLTRYFADVARYPEWAVWLYQKGHLTGLFNAGDLTVQQQVLAHWLASTFAIGHSDTLFAIISAHGATLNPQFWHQLGQQFGQPAQENADANVVSRWVTFLVNNIPSQAQQFILLGMAETCANVEVLPPLLLAYDAMSSVHNRPLAHGARVRESYEMQQLWEKCLKPHLSAIAESLLERTVRRLEERNTMLLDWGKATESWNEESFRRSAIEPHGQNDLSSGCDTMIDIARDCLEWLVANQPDTARIWSQRYANSPVHLLRRLAIHTLTERPDLSADGKVAWLLAHCDIHETAARHEIFRAARAAYPQASTEQRSVFVEAILSYRWPHEADFDAEEMSAQRHLTWLHWLNESTDGDAITEKAIADIRLRHTAINPSKHPDFTHYWSGLTPVYGTPSQWTAHELLTQPLDAWLQTALDLNPQDNGTGPRDRLIDQIAEASRRQPGWGAKIATKLAQDGVWTTAIWRGITEGWIRTSAQLEDQNIASVIAAMSATRIHQEYGAEIAAGLMNLINHNRSAMSASTLASANKIAQSLWEHIPDRSLTTNAGWMTDAINHPAGHLARFWVASIARWLELQSSAPTVLSDEYQQAMSKIMSNRERPGKLARVVLTAHLPFLATVDEEWVKVNLMPLLSPGNDEYETAWSGMTSCGGLYPQTAELLSGTFLKAAANLHATSPGPRRQFIQMYTSLLEWFADGPTSEWITTLLAQSEDETRQWFAEHITHILRISDETRIKEMWATWLSGYWENRLLGIPAPLCTAETRAMIDWTFHLQAVYPEAVALAVKMPPVTLSNLVLNHMDESPLLDEHPEWVARLLVHIGEAPQSAVLWMGKQEDFEKLLRSNLPHGLRSKLKELIARIGMT